MEQSKEGKHYEIYFNAFITIYLSLFELYIKEILSKNVILRISIEVATTKYSKNKKCDLVTLVGE